MQCRRIGRSRPAAIRFNAAATPPSDTRNQIRYHGTNTEVPTLAEPTPDQRLAFDLIGTPIPLMAA
jgi:hypothetical protein